MSRICRRLYGRLKAAATRTIGARKISAYPHPTFTVVCERHGTRFSDDTRRLIAVFGPDATLEQVGRRMLKCNGTGEGCSLLYTEAVEPAM